MRMLHKFLFFVKRPWLLPISIIIKFPYFRFIRNTSTYQNPINFNIWFIQKVLGKGGNKSVYWPVHPNSQIYDWQNIFAGIDTCPGLMKGCYIQGKGGIYIGDYTQIAPNVVIVSANHDVYNTRKHILKKVSIGKYCWIGANSSIMPGVKLGNFTIVGAGSVVTKPFPDGYCVIAGNPAKVIYELEKEKCLEYEYDKKFYGYLNESKFQKLLKKYPTIPVY